MTTALSLAALLLGACANPALAAENNFADFSARTNAAAAAPAGATRYLHLEGAVRGKADPGALLKELDETFAAPLRRKPPMALFSEDDQAGGGRVLMNLILEPSSPADAAAVDAYVARLQAQGFRGLPVVFQAVSRIRLDASLQIGMYAPDEEDAFIMHDEVAAQADFPSISAWLASYNPMGRAVIAKKHEDFIEFVRRFVADPARFAEIRERVLPVNNMIELVTRTTAELPGGAVAGPLLDTGPFLPFSFVRDCFEPRYENGMCAGSPARVPVRKLPEGFSSKVLPPADFRWN